MKVASYTNEIFVKSKIMLIILYIKSYFKRDDNDNKNDKDYKVDKNDKDNKKTKMTKVIILIKIS